MKTVDELPAGFRFYRGTDANGGLIMYWPDIKTSSDKIALSGDACLVLVLNELCAERGRGKFYLFAQNSEADVFKGKTKAWAAFHKLADLLYTPHTWSKAEQDKWLTTPPEDLLHLSSARLGWLDDSILVLPIAAQTKIKTQDKIFLSGYTTAPVTIAIEPIPYVAYTGEFRQVSEQPHTDPYGILSIVCLPHDVNQFKLADGLSVIDKIESMFWENRNDSLAFYGSMRLEYIRACEEAADAGEPYGCLQGQTKPVAGNDDAGNNDNEVEGSATGDGAGDGAAEGARNGKNNEGDGEATAVGL